MSTLVHAGDCNWFLTFLRGYEFVVNLKWYYDENRIFPVEAIIKHKQVVCKRRKMQFTFFQISVFIPEIFKFLKNLQISQVMSSIILNQSLIKYDEKNISANL